MFARVLLSVMFAFISLSVKAEGSQWLTNLIAEQEGAVTHQREEPQNTKREGFFSTHGLILFYGSQCPHCKQFAPILKQWVARNKAEVLSLSLDNQPLPEFPKYAPATTEWINAAFGGNAINYPALFVVNPKTHALYPVGFGSMTQAELNDRMEVLIRKIKAYEHTGRIK
ncbi:TPA: type-F conjugative transfer system pilin assembly thiol-disulfide isomerase TrbB [Legionella pneumophila]|uniref:type-F conjugative transfer system pilin assembly thiol-disulfide isomerase TrbB n=1 Tax=Legionella pneumophila TaxID=446 RepID=UPI00077706A2|nr:type-F conjugative transfer system pilin assembly thiol-disulfide isomerase TrbB [Legionella pneumophila]HAT1800880.1 type-F conjugative transfer system pilin assembly thiol-disulfide isomerase TrbB [Legionella pneumophila]HAT8574499.1 type-F conjugative transfer system pilin assembly thiol-disulfide isomerase TrbB [Legionella pneumophila]HAU1256864.1 type-F conjugative transfer system pilin assembly thiol-disulfide isomerase TrbB [Legionella pneumophila]HAU1559638.1 type-F conjugative trans